MKRPEQALASLLKKHKLTIALAESMTCGLAAHRLGSIAQTSDILRGSIVCYDEHVKRHLLKVGRKLIKKHTAESQKVTNALAENLSGLIKADIHAAITGLASPGGSETKAKPVGTVFIAFVFRGKLYKSRMYFKGSPLNIKEKSCAALFRLVTVKLKGRMKR